MERSCNSGFLTSPQPSNKRSVFSQLMYADSAVASAFTSLWAGLLARCTIAAGRLSPNREAYHIECVWVYNEPWIRDFAITTTHTVQTYNLLNIAMHIFLWCRTLYDPLEWKDQFSKHVSKKFKFTAYSAEPESIAKTSLLTKRRIDYECHCLTGFYWKGSVFLSPK